ncbi:HEAT repeat-containing protein 5A [Hordeum vulgare]|nr:HEAT repeat-containing protein 5A [Hordeum vulgare]
MPVLARPSSPSSFHEERALVEDVLREPLAPRRHGMLVHLSDAEAALPPLVRATVLFGHKLRARREPLRPLTRHHLEEIHLPTRSPEAPRRCIVRLGGVFGVVEHAEAEAHLAGADLGGEGIGWARADAAVARTSLTVWQRQGEKEERQKGRVARQSGGEGV